MYAIQWNFRIVPFSTSFLSSPLPQRLRVYALFAYIFEFHVIQLERCQSFWSSSLNCISHTQRWQAVASNRYTTQKKDIILHAHRPIELCGKRRWVCCAARKDVRDERNVSLHCTNDMACRARANTTIMNMCSNHNLNTIQPGETRRDENAMSIKITEKHIQPFYLFVSPSTRTRFSWLDRRHTEMPKDLSFYLTPQRAWHAARITWISAATGDASSRSKRLLLGMRGKCLRNSY